MFRLVNRHCQLRSSARVLHPSRPVLRWNPWLPGAWVGRHGRLHQGAVRGRWGRWPGGCPGVVPNSGGVLGTLEVWGDFMTRFRGTCLDLEVLWKQKIATRASPASGVERWIKGDRWRTGLPSASRKPYCRQESLRWRGSAPRKGWVYCCNMVDTFLFALLRHIHNCGKKTSQIHNQVFC